jgi:hypothetical protein
MFEKLLTTENMFDIISIEQLFVTNVRYGGCVMSEAMRAAATLYNDPRYFSESEIRIRKNRIRRARIFRRQVFLLSAAIALVIFMVILFASTIKSEAQSEDYSPEFKYYKTVTVHSDDTMWNIASVNYSPEHYNDMKEYMAEICSINGISDSNRLNAGESLVIPYYSVEFK